MNFHNKAKAGQVKEITSLTNPVIKNLRALSLKKVREREGLFLAEGLKLIIDALELGWEIHTLAFAKAAADNPLLAKIAAQTVAGGGLVIKTSEKIMAAMTRRDNPQTVIGTFSQRWHRLEKADFNKNSLFIGLDRIRDPGNLGTIIRTADAAGAAGVILIGDTTTPFSLETVRATMGSVFAVPLYRASEKHFLEWRKNFPGLVVGTHLKGADDYRMIDYAKGPVLLLMGNEQQGLPESLAACCDQLARIPQSGRADSLNLAVATGIMIYEIRRGTFAPDIRGARP